VDSLADGIPVPNSMVELHHFGMVMGTGRLIHRKGYRRLWEDMLILSSQDVPIEVFRAAAYSEDEAQRMYYDFNAGSQFKIK
jgi:hypothetical protein